MSRTGQSWGIPVPSDPGSVVYVWMDALINYVSGVGYGTDDALFDTWWPADLHVSRQGHHAVPLRGLARDADERRRRAAAAGVRARLGPLAGPEDEASRSARPWTRWTRSSAWGRIRCGCT